MKHAPAKPSRHVGYDLMRIISICGVVAIHTFGPLAGNPEIAGTLTWFAATVLSSGFVWAVPVFVMLSGALNLREQSHSAGPRMFYVARFRRILPALLVWTLVYLVVVRMLLLGEQLSFGQAVVDIAEARVYPHLYFLWLIAGLYVVAPVLASFLHQADRRRATIVATISLVFTVLVIAVYSYLAFKGVAEPIHLGALTIWIAYIGYFLAGYALSLWRFKGVWLVALGGTLLASGATHISMVALPTRLVALSAIAPPEYLGPIVAALSVCVFVLGVTLLNRVRVGRRASKIMRTLADASFGVFLVHLVVMLVPYWLLAGYHTRSSLVEGVVAYVFVLTTSFAISVGARLVPGLRLIF